MLKKIRLKKWCRLVQELIQKLFWRACFGTFCFSKKSSSWDMGPGTRTRDSDQGPGTWDQDMGPGTWDQGQGPGTLDQGQGPGTILRRARFVSGFMSLVPWRWLFRKGWFLKKHLFTSGHMLFIFSKTRVLTFGFSYIFIYMERSDSIYGAKRGSGATQGGGVPGSPAGSRGVRRPPISAGGLEALDTTFMTNLV